MPYKMSATDFQELVDKNQSIKIVPSVEDSLRAIGLNVDLDVNTQNWYQQLVATWKTWKRSATLENHIELFLNSIPDPFRIVLVFVIKSEDAKDCKLKTLPYFIVEILQKWALANNKSSDDNLKLPAFHIAIQQRNSHFLNLVVKTYQISTIRETIIPLVKDMIKKDNCKLASQVIIAVELFDDIPVEDLLFPLILQDKTNLIDEYLSECPNQVMPLLCFLDKLLDKSLNLREYAQNYIDTNNIYHVKYDKIHYKPLGKLVARLCNKFNIPIENCKNLSKNRTTGGLRYLIHQKYQEHNVSSSVWDDLVKDSLKQNMESAQEFIDMLVEYDKNEAHKWATYLKIPEQLLPLALKEMTLQEPIEEECWDVSSENTSQLYYKSSLADDDIILVDTAEKFYDLMISDLNGCNVVSMDCEWKPSFGAKQSQVALIQIATNKKVYLIDTLILNNPSYTSFWHTFHKSFLNNAEIIKLGFGLEQDLKEIKSSVVGLGNININGEGLLDMSLLWKSLLNSGLSLPSHEDSVGNSLSYLVQSCFGLPLEKSEQCSNWELRPLRKTQIVYAALDAYVLIDLYNFLQKKCLDQGINFEQICNEVMTEKQKKRVKKVKGHERVQNFVPNIPNKSTIDIKFIVEPKLSHLTSYLRYCGIDTIIMPETMLWFDVVNMAISEDRFILLNKYKGTPNSNFPQTSILDVGKGSIKDQLNIILNRFCLSVNKEDLMRFCMKCNSKDLKKLDPQEVNKLCNEYQMCGQLNYNHKLEVDDYDNEPNYDGFLSDSDGDEDLYHVVNTIQPKETCKTSKGAVIEIDGVNMLSISNKPAILCETCGGLFWKDDELTKIVSDIILKLTNVYIW